MRRPLLNPNPDKAPDGSWAFWKEMLFILWVTLPSPSFRQWLLEKRYPPRPGSGCSTCEGMGRVVVQGRLVYFGDLLTVLPCPKCRKPPRKDYVRAWELFWVGMTFAAGLAWVLWGMGL